MAGRVYHWKHGWVPLDAYARSIKAGSRFDGDKAHFFGGDKKWAKASAFDVPDWDEAANRRKDRWGNKPIVRHVLQPHDSLVATQPGYSQEVVDQYRRSPQKAPYLSMMPQVLLDEDGKMYVLEGHHRILADRLEGRQTVVQLLDLRIPQS